VPTSRRAGESDLFGDGGGTADARPGVGVQDALAELKGILEDARLRKAGHDLKFDAIVLERHGVALAGIETDTMLASYLLDATRSAHPLEELAIEHAGYKALREQSPQRRPSLLRLRAVPEVSLLNRQGLDRLLRGDHRQSGHRDISHSYTPPHSDRDQDIDPAALLIELQLGWTDRGIGEAFGAKEFLQDPNIQIERLPAQEPVVEERRRPGLNLALEPLGRKALVAGKPYRSHDHFRPFLDHESNRLRGIFYLQRCLNANEVIAVLTIERLDLARVGLDLGLVDDPAIVEHKPLAERGILQFPVADELDPKFRALAQLDTDIDAVFSAIPRHMAIRDAPLYRLWADGRSQALFPQLTDFRALDAEGGRVAALQRKEIIIFGERRDLFPAIGFGVAVLASPIFITIALRLRERQPGEED